jgi:hypothetical protein
VSLSKSKSKSNLCCNERKDGEKKTERPIAISSAY